jgi:hypothetical protein
MAECLGYFTIELPGEFEYALMDDFSQGLGAWGSEIRLDLVGADQQELLISPPATASTLKLLMEARNREQQREIDEVTGYLAETDRPSLKTIYASKLAAMQLYAPLPERNAISRIEKAKLEFNALVNGHIFHTSLPIQGTPGRTFDAFLSHYKPRALGEIPKGPGVCVPFGVFSNEKYPAAVGLNLQLKAQPDIVVFLLARDAAGDTPQDAKKYIDRKAVPMTMFLGSRDVAPLNRLRPYESVSIDGHAGTAAFVRIKRERQGFAPEIHNASEDDLDMGFLAYIPGTAGGNPGESFNIEFKVERFGRFANRRMSEKEFRDLVMRIASSIKRRPGAWQSPR